MARANRHYIPGHVWHLTHRCHKREFLLKFAKDRQRWMQWLYEAKKKYKLVVLDYMVTSNHTHLLVYDQEGKEAIPKSIQLLAGRTGQEYNQRKNRNGAFWQDRYHATAVETGEHLLQCIVYIDLNMIRTGTVDHPSQWDWCGYHEIQKPRRKNILINYDKLRELAGFDTFDHFQAVHRRWIENGLSKFQNNREAQWSESIAIGSDGFVNNIQSQLGARAKGRKVHEIGDAFQLREPIETYNVLFDDKKCDMAPENAIEWIENV